MGSVGLRVGDAIELVVDVRGDPVPEAVVDVDVSIGVPATDGALVAARDWTVTGKVGSGDVAGGALEAGVVAVAGGVDGGAPEASTAAVEGATSPGLLGVRGIIPLQKTSG